MVDSLQAKQDNIQKYKNIEQAENNAYLRFMERKEEQKQSYMSKKLEHERVKYYPS